MPIALLLLLQVALPGSSPPPDDSAYASVALRRLVQRSAERNAQIPIELRGYRAEAESEISIVVRSSREQESALQIEQIERTVRWQRPNELERRVLGYRARASTSNVSTLTYLKRPWIVPPLYGNRMTVLLTQGRNATESTRTPVLAAHPFAADRDAYYRFSGGDTAAVLHANGRAISVVRIEVDPAIVARPVDLMFHGEIDVDATRYRMVRMRGEFVHHATQSSLRDRVRHLAPQVVAYAELENGEYLGAYSLPTYQRIEAQGRSPVASELRPVFRVVSRFRRHTLDGWDGESQAVAATSDSSMQELAERLTTASRDRISRITGWRREIGDETIGARASDFDDVAPDDWRTRGPARIDWHAEQLSDVFRFDRVEGRFTGASATFRLRDRAPRLSLGATAGWAWSEQAVRGAAVARRIRGPWPWELRAERRLANTNDFRPTLDFEASLMAALVTADDYDYVDRRLAGVSTTHALRGWSRAGIRLESGFVADRAVRSHAHFGQTHLDFALRSNRPIDAGHAWRNAVSPNVHPNVSAEWLEPGVGGGISYERGDGEIRWRRLDGRLIGRHTWHALTYAAPLDVAAALGPPVPRQQRIEFGENEGLPGYLYKEFGGDRAALLRGNVAYRLPFLQAPVRSWRGIVLPSLTPSIAVGLPSGWAGASASTLQQLSSFGFRRDSLTGDPLLDPRTGLPVLAAWPTDGVRSTFGVTLRLFGGAVGIGMARALDRGQPWRVTLGVGQGL